MRRAAGRGGEGGGGAGGGPAPAGDGGTRVAGPEAGPERPVPARRPGVPGPPPRVHGGQGARGRRAELHVPVRGDVGQERPGGGLRQGRPVRGRAHVGDPRPDAAAAAGHAPADRHVPGLVDVLGRHVRRPAELQGGAAVPPVLGPAGRDADQGVPVLEDDAVPERGELAVQGLQRRLLAPAEPAVLLQGELQHGEAVPGAPGPDQQPVQREGGVREWGVPVPGRVGGGRGATTG